MPLTRAKPCPCEIFVVSVLFWFPHSISSPLLAVMPKGVVRSGEGRPVRKGYEIVPRLRRSHGGERANHLPTIYDGSR
jgi:hypothetical protein